MKSKHYINFCGILTAADKLLPDRDLPSPALLLCEAALRCEARVGRNQDILTQRHKATERKWRQPVQDTSWSSWLRVSTNLFAAGTYDTCVELSGNPFQLLRVSNVVSMVNRKSSIRGFTHVIRFQSTITIERKVA
jgi:hypothetical protein